MDCAADAAELVRFGAVAVAVAEPVFAQDVALGVVGEGFAAGVCVGGVALNYAGEPVQDKQQSKNDYNFRSSLAVVGKRNFGDAHSKA